MKKKSGDEKNHRFIDSDNLMRNRVLTVGVIDPRVGERLKGVVTPSTKKRETKKGKKKLSTIRQWRNGQFAAIVFCFFFFLKNILYYGKKNDLDRSTFTWSTVCRICTSFFFIPFSFQNKTKKYRFRIILVGKWVIDFAFSRPFQVLETRGRLGWIVSTGLYWVWLGLTRFDYVFLVQTWFSKVSLGFGGLSIGCT